MPRVSVVLIFLNGERFIEEAIESVRAQSFGEWELILVDDGSSDGSTEIARRFAADDARIRYVEHAGHANRGMSASRNLGAHHSTGEYLAFLDADDVWSMDKLTEQVSILERGPVLALVCGALLYWHSWDPLATEEDRHVLTGGIADQRLDPPEAALALYPLGEGAGAGLDVLIRRTAFDAVGGFEERFRGLYEDQAFLLKIFLRFPIFISSRAWLCYRQHDASCCATTTRSAADYRRLRGEFIDWLSRYVRDERLAQPQVGRAIARARRQLQVAKLRSLAGQALQPIRSLRS